MPAAVDASTSVRSRAVGWPDAVSAIDVTPVAATAGIRLATDGRFWSLPRNAAALGLGRTLMLVTTALLFAAAALIRAQPIPVDTITVRAVLLIPQVLEPLPVAGLALLGRLIVRAAT